MPDNLRRHARRLILILLAVLTAGCRGVNVDFYPLAPGRWWYYAIDETVLEEPRSRRYLVRNLAPTRVDGEIVAVQAVQAASFDYLSASAAGLVRIAHRRADRPGLVVDEPPRLILPAGADRKRRWQVSSTLALIESRTFERTDHVIVRRLPVTIEKRVVSDEAAVNVPAGRFAGCLQVTGVGHAVVQTDRGNSEAQVQVETSEWYAPGIGLVMLERRESSKSSFLKTGTQRWTLSAYGD